MPETGRTIECGDCGKLLDEPTDQAISERKPCLDCGSFRRHVRIAFSGTMTFREKMKLKVNGCMTQKYLSLVWFFPLLWAYSSPPFQIIL